MLVSTPSIELLGGEPIVSLTDEITLQIDRSSLRSYFADGTLAAAKRAFDLGQYEKVKVLLARSPASHPTRFLGALATMRQGDFPAAARAFESLASSYTPLSDRCFLLAGQAYEAAKDWSHAASVYEQISPWSRLQVEARLGRARAHRSQKNFALARAAIDVFTQKSPPAWGRDVGAEVLLLTADLFAAENNREKERETLLAIWARHPLSSEARTATARLGKMKQVDVRFQIERAEALIEAHRNEQGVSILEPLRSQLIVGETWGCRAHYSLGKAYRKLRSHTKACAILEPVVAQCHEDSELHVKALYTLATSQSIATPELSISTFERLAKEYPKSRLADDGLFHAADVANRLGDTARARELLSSLMQVYPEGDFAAEGQFKLFWMAASDENYDEATQILEQIGTQFAMAADTYNVERAAYWRGRIFELQGQKEAAVRVFTRLSREHPTTYYGSISRERLEGMAPRAALAAKARVAELRQSVDLFPLEAGPLAGDRSFQSALEYLRLGLSELATAEIRSIDTSELPPSSLRLLVVMLREAGDERLAHGLARVWLKGDLSGPITPETRAIWELAYPRAFRPMVETHSKTARGLEADLLQALMREESALDPKALSWAGAMGLCQLMPKTASWMADRIRIPRPSKQALLEPELNIKLGAHYLSDLMNRSNGVKQFALASYNAGEGSVARWKRTFGDDDVAAWVEQIPIDETRGYVKRVLRTYNTYKLLYDVDALRPHVTRPAKAVTKRRQAALSKS